MTNRERFQKLLHFAPDIDRTPVIEWACWWDKTVNAWYDQGLPRDIQLPNWINDYFGQDRLKQFVIPVRGPHCPTPSSHGAPIIWDEKDYHALKRDGHLYNEAELDHFCWYLEQFLKDNQDNDFAFWITLDGFFWFPRTLFGIENHLYAFYDYPDLMLEINDDLCTYYQKALEKVYSIFTPDFMTFAEDMSYNLGPMLSREQYNQFMLPFYNRLIPFLRNHGTVVIIDTDGNVEPLIPWFLDGGIQGILPLERMAGVDVNRIRATYPDLIMIGGFDKTVMHKGEKAMRAEFERILPAIRSGGYIPSVDHQTPPDVSMENYRIFMRLLREYSEKIGT